MRMFTCKRLKSPPEVEFWTERFFFRSSEMERSPQPLSDGGGDSVFTCTRLKLHLEGLRLHPPVFLLLFFCVGTLKSTFLFTLVVFF